MNRPKCKKCNTELSGQVVNKITVCPSCGKSWALTSDLTTIDTVVLIVQDSQIGVISKYIGEKNG